MAELSPDVLKLSAASFKTALSPSANTYQAFFSKPAGSTTATVVLVQGSDQTGITNLEKTTGSKPVVATINSGVLHVGLGSASASRSAGAARLLAVE